MSDRAHIGLDNPAFSGRLRQSQYTRRPQPVRAARTTDISLDKVVDKVVPEPVAEQVIVTVKTPALPRKVAENRTPTFGMPVNAVVAPEVAVVKAQPFVRPAAPKQQRSNVLKRQLGPLPSAKIRVAADRPTGRGRLGRYSKLQIGLVGMACLVFVVGMTVSLQTLKTNHVAAAQVAALSKKASSNSSDDQTDVPSTVKPTAQAVSSYAVAPDLARYLVIPKLGVNARVLQVGVNSSGALGTPNNVFDTAWYTGSAKPGQTGATLIDGHVSSWTTHGVFYGIKTLKAGDTIQIQRGDGKILTYQVVKTQVYDANNVDMQAAVTSVVAGKSGLNLITCTGDVQKGTSEFNKRVIVFSVLQN